MTSSNDDAKDEAARLVADAVAAAKKRRQAQAPKSAGRIVADLIGFGVVLVCGGCVLVLAAAVLGFSVGVFMGSLRAGFQMVAP